MNPPLSQGKKKLSYLEAREFAEMERRIAEAEQMLQMKHEIEQLTCEIMHLRQHLGKKLAVIESVCLIGVLVVGCVIGVLVAMLCK